MPDLIASGIEGLDIILGGGFIPGGITIIQGRPGTGKTIFGNQLCFNHARAGGRALYVTLLAESHARMLMHLESLKFFDLAAIPDRIYYVSAFSVLEADGLRGLLTLLRRETAAREATVLVLDGLVPAERGTTSDLEMKKFIHELQIQATVAGCAMFLMTSAGEGDVHVSAEHTMVDCVIDMRSRLYGWRSERDVEIVKRRGASYMLGRHALAITDAGIGAYPRFEALPARPSATAPPPGDWLPSGLSQLDRMFGGGVPRHSMTLLEGPPGVGKTTFGLHFLGACARDEPGLLFTTADRPEALLAKAQALHLPIAPMIKSGQVEVVWQQASEGLIDAAFQRLMQAVSRVGARRLCIDDLTGLLELAPDRARLPAMLAALIRELRTLGVTSLVTAAIDEGSAPGALPPAGALLGNLPSVIDNIVVLDLSEQWSSRTRLLSVLKARDAPIDRRPHSYEISSRGIVIDGTPFNPEASSIDPASGSLRPEA